jgi:hypothetical protein
VNGRSVQFLLRSGDEGEEADNNDVDPLVEYERSLAAYTSGHEFFSWDGSRSIDNDGRHRDSKNARGCCTRRPYNVEHDALTSIFHQRFTKGDATWAF